MSKREKGYCDGACVANGAECNTHKEVSAELTIARLRSELASAREPTECPEYTGDEATVRCHLGSLLYAHEALDRLLASARELGAALASILDHSPHVGITQPGGHVTCWTAQMDSGRERVYADGATMVDALLALRAKQGGE